MKSLLLFVCSFLPVIVFGDRAKPNVVYILADDLGYGDLKSMNPEGKIKTPGSDQMAREGMVFTDAHSNSAVCTPTFCNSKGFYHRYWHHKRNQEIHENPK